MRRDRLENKQNKRIKVSTNTHLFCIYIPSQHPPPPRCRYLHSLLVDPIKTKQKHASQHPPSPVVVTVTAQKETVRNSVMAIFQRNRETDIADNISASSQEEEPRERHRRRRDPSSRLADA